MTDELDFDDHPATTCDLCGHPHAEKHRVVPERWGGTYAEHNVVMLCPNHHAAIHYMMAWYEGGVRHKKGRRDDDARLLSYMADARLRPLWLHVVKPIVIERLRSEGFWFPRQPYEFNPNSIPGLDQGWLRYHYAIDRLSA